MSVPLIIEGTLDEVEAKLLMIQDIIDRRKVSGWPLFQQGEKWLYTTRPDLGKVCPVCLPHEGAVYDGAEAKRLFPLEMTSKYVASPRVHRTQEAVNLRIVGPCHCDLILQNPAEVMEMRLHEDKMAVI